MVLEKLIIESKTKVDQRNIKLSSKIPEKCDSETDFNNKKKNEMILKILEILPPFNEEIKETDKSIICEILGLKINKLGFCFRINRISRND